MGKPKGYSYVGTKKYYAALIKIEKFP